MKNFKLPDISLKSLSLKSLSPKSFSLKSLSLDSITLPFNINLQRRDKLVIAIAGSVLALFILLQLIIFPIIGYRDKLHTEIESKSQELQEIKIGKDEYHALTRNTQNMDSRLARRSKTFTLFSFVERLAGKSGIKGNIVSMKPSTSSVKNSDFKLSGVNMKLNALTMEQLTSFLHGLEDPKNIVWIKSITISKSDKNEGLLNTVLQAETFQK